MDEVDFAAGVTVLLAAAEPVDEPLFPVVPVLLVLPALLLDSKEAALFFDDCFAVEDVDAFLVVAAVFVVFPADFRVDFAVDFFVDVVLDLAADLEVLAVLAVLGLLEVLEPFVAFVPVAGALLAAESGDFVVFFLEDFAAADEVLEDLEVSALGFVAAVFFLLVVFFLANGCSVPGAGGGSGP
ncbi:MAG: hypothetical protein ACOC1G_00940 [Phycisphaeraceae bacterium]